MSNEEINKIEEIDEAINPITPEINSQSGLEILGRNRNQAVILSRFSRSFFKVYSHLTYIYSNLKSLTTGKEDKFDKKTGFNLNKTDLTENDSSKLFTAKGALALYNTLTTNYTNLVNSLKENLNLHIVKKSSSTQDGHMSKEDKIKLDSIAENANNYTLPVATNSSLGGIKIGSGINIAPDGTISVIQAREGLVPVGAFLTLGISNNPALMFPGTTWEKIEERFLYGTNGETGQLGGRNSMSLTVAQLARHLHSAWTDQQGNHTHTQDAHLHTQPSHQHVTEAGGGYSGNGGPSYAQQEGTWRKSTTSNWAGGENTGSAQPAIKHSGQHSHNVGIGETGNGEEFSIMPAYYTVNFWKRVS